MKEYLITTWLPILVTTYFATAGILGALFGCVLSGTALARLIQRRWREAIRPALFAFCGFMFMAGVSINLRLSPEIEALIVGISAIAGVSRFAYLLKYGSCRQSMSPTGP